MSLGSANEALLVPSGRAAPNLPVNKQSAINESALLKDCFAAKFLRKSYCRSISEKYALVEQKTCLSFSIARSLIEKCS